MHWCLMHLGECVCKPSIQSSTCGMDGVELVCRAEANHVAPKSAANVMVASWYRISYASEALAKNGTYPAVDLRGQAEPSVQKNVASTRTRVRIGSRVGKTTTPLTPGVD